MDTQYAEKEYLYAKQEEDKLCAATDYVETHAHVMIQKVKNGWVITTHGGDTYVAQSTDQAILLMQGLCQKAIDRLT